MFKFSILSLLFAVLLTAVFFAGVRVGQRTPSVDGPRPRAMAFVKSITVASDREAYAIFSAATMIEESKPGYLLSIRPIVKAEQQDDPGDWKVSFTDPAVGKPWHCRSYFSDSSIQDYLRKRDEGFELVAQ